MPTETPLPKDDPRLVAWEKWKKNKGFDTTVSLRGTFDEITELLRPVYLAGYEAGKERGK